MSQSLTSQITTAPPRKVTAQALGGAFAALTVWAVQAFTATDVPPGIEGALTVIFGFFCGHFVKDEGAVAVVVENTPDAPVLTAPADADASGAPAFSDPTRTDNP